jgi:signal transduction histidine kinase
MTAVQRRAFQTIVLVVPALVAFVELQHFWLPTFDRPAIIALDDLLPGSAFAVAGLIAWSRRPRNPVGVLMICIGFGLLIGIPGLRGGSSPLADTLDLVFGGGWTLVLFVIGFLWAVALLHLLLVFPGGLFVSRLDRALVGLLYLAVPLGGLIPAFVTFNSFQGTTGIDAYYNAAGLSAATAFVVYGLCLVLGSGLIIRRWVLAGPARRRSMSPVMWSLIPIWLAFMPSQLLPIVANGPIATLWQQFVAASPLFLVVLPAGFLIAMLRSDYAMSSVGDLVVKLSAGLLPEQLQPALAKTLRDPSLEVVYWLPTLGWFADLDGKPVSLPAADSLRAVTVLGDPANPVAALVYDSSLRQEAHLVNTAAAAVRLVLENARLQVQLRAQLDEVQQSRARLVEAADSERRRVERDLHDGAQQQLVTLLLSLQLAKTEALQRSDPNTALMLDGSIESLRQALGELRTLARGLHPTILAEAGLVPAIRSLAERCPIRVEVIGELDRIEPRLETALYFVVAEAITNAVKHSRGQRICVELRRRSGWATVDVSDDGVGGADRSRGSGLVGLSDRVAAVGGRLNVQSNQLHGTSLHAEVPCA